MQGYTSLKLRMTIDVNGKPVKLGNTLGYLVCWSTYDEALKDAGSDDLVLPFNYGKSSEEGRG